MATVDCGNLHIRTPETDFSLSPNNIIQSITNSGLKIGIIPETSVSDMKDFIITIKNNVNNIIFQNSIPIPQLFYGDYIFVTIPFSVIPKINEVISIKIVGTTGCVFTKNYTILSYSSLSVFQPAISPLAKPTDKYIKITPTLTQYGFISGSSYFFKCDKNTDSDDNCLTQFNNNTDLSKIISFLPYGTTLATCVDSDDWVYVDTVCVQSGLLPTTSTTVLPVSSTPTLSTVSASNLTYTNIVSNSVIKLYKDDIYTNQSITATSSGVWNGLSLISGVYKITSTETNKSESAKSNAITFNVTTVGSVTATPTLNAVTATTITYSSYTTGTTLKLYKDGIYTNLSIVANSGTWTGLTLTTGAYTITATDTSKTESAKSNSITFTVSTGVSIVEPKQSQYFFSEGNSPSYYSSGLNLPAIKSHSSPAYYTEADECVIISNANVKYTINLRRGGHVSGAFKVDNTFNYIYNGYDGGFQVGIDIHQNPSKQYTQGGSNSINCQDDTGYNVTHGGTFTGTGISYTPTLIDYHTVGTNGYYIKFRPLLYTLIPAQFAENYIEVTYTLIGDTLKADYIYTSFRTDNQFNTGIQSFFIGQSTPACFLNANLTRFKTYIGSSAWTDGALTDDLIPTSNVCATPNTANSSEHWGFAYNPTTNLGFGIMNLTNLSADAGIVYKQCEVSAGNSPSEFGGGFTYIAPTLSVMKYDSGSFVLNTTAYMMVGDVTSVRSQFKTISGH
jgi:hypothetical protein